MSEIVEVKLTVDLLSKECEGRIVQDLVFLNKTKRTMNEFYKSLPSLVAMVVSKGKLIVIKLQNEHQTSFIFCKLADNCYWSLCKTSASVSYLELYYGKKLFFNDLKGEGSLDVSLDEFDYINRMNAIGLDLLSDQLSLSVWKQLLSTFETLRIAILLEKQEIIAGCGTYLTSEILHYAKVHPNRLVSTLSDTEKEKLYEGIQVVCRLAYVHGGYHFPNCFGKRGSYRYYVSVYGLKTSKKIKLENGSIVYIDDKIQKLG
jgi:formamidopyrimidine-DNA glycosylase